MPETQGSDSLPGILADIVGTKRAELEKLQSRASELEVAAARAAAPRDFAGALSAPPHVSLIAECKRRSPGAGPIRPGLDPVELTQGYARAGAAALSVLTDRDYFAGSLADLEAVRHATPLPVLRKDFTIDSLQILEARAAGADAVLLIVRILSDPELRRLHEMARGLGMCALVEVHGRSELDRALALGDDIVVGINNRDLSNFRTDLHTTLELLDIVPDGVIVVSESGIRTPEDVERLGDAGVDAILVGETLLRAEDPEDAARGLSSIPRRERIRG